MELAVKTHWKHCWFVCFRQAHCSSHPTQKTERVDAVLIASPTTTHVEYIRLAAAHSKPVFVDKPVAFEPEDIRTCFAETKAKSVPLLCGLLPPREYFVVQLRPNTMTGYQRRFDPDFIKVKEAVMRGEIGQPQLLLLTARDHPPPPAHFFVSAGRCFVVPHRPFAHPFHRELLPRCQQSRCRYRSLAVGCGLCPLLIFALSFCDAGEEPSFIYGTGSSFLQATKTVGADDTAVAVLCFPSGAICVINNSRYYSLYLRDVLTGTYCE
jgi:myo-inositol 2-dehydrogenase/D-chiro-inositol 1-dehydrogenase